MCVGRGCFPGAWVGAADLFPHCWSDDDRRNPRSGRDARRGRGRLAGRRVCRRSDRCPRPRGCCRTRSTCRGAGQSRRPAARAARAELCRRHRVLHRRHRQHDADPRRGEGERAALLRRRAVQPHREGQERRRAAGARRRVPRHRRGRRGGAAGVAVLRAAGRGDGIQRLRQRPDRRGRRRRARVRSGGRRAGDELAVDDARRPAPAGHRGVDRSAGAPAGRRRAPARRSPGACPPTSAR